MRESHVVDNVISILKDFDCFLGNVKKEEGYLLAVNIGNGYTLRMKPKDEAFDLVASTTYRGNSKSYRCVIFKTDNYEQIYISISGIIELTQ